MFLQDKNKSGEITDTFLLVRRFLYRSLSSCCWIFSSLDAVHHLLTFLILFQYTWTPWKYSTTISLRKKLKNNMPQILVIRRMQHFSSEEFRTKEENQNDVWSTFFFFFYARMFYFDYSNSPSEWILGNQIVTCHLVDQVAIMYRLSKINLFNRWSTVYQIKKSNT